MGIAEAFNFIYASFCPHVPKLDDAVTADTAKLCILDGVKGNSLDLGGMTFKLSGEAGMRPIGIPYNGNRLEYVSHLVLCNKAG